MSVQGNWGRGIIGPNIVWDGLVVYYDMSNSNSSQGSGTVLRDLSPNQGYTTASLSSVGAGYVYNNTFPNSLSFISGSGIRASGSFTLSNFGTAFTTIIVASSPTPTWNPNSPLVASTRGGNLIGGGCLNSPQTVTNGFSLGCYYNTSISENRLTGVVRTTSTAEGTEYLNLTGVDITKPHIYCFSYNDVDGGCIGYDDNINTYASLPLTGRVPSDLTLYFSWVDKSSSTYASQYLNYNLYSAMVYNRGLSQTELIQTYHALKSRYGLS